jgi:hypothetical protein
LIIFLLLLIKAHYGKIGRNPAVMREVEMSEIHHDEYFQRYKALQALLEQAYVDIYALQEIERYNESVKEGNRALLKSSYNVLGHICELLKADLGLTIWKIHSDGNGKANTINKLREFINHNYLDLIHENEIPKMSLPKSLRTTEKKLSQLRNTFLAHNDAEKSHAMFFFCSVSIFLGASGQGAGA